MRAQNGEAREDGAIFRAAALSGAVNPLVSLSLQEMETRVEQGGIVSQVFEGQPLSEDACEIHPA